MFNQRFLY